MTQHYLSTPVRRALEKVVKEARDVAEAGAAEAIRRLGVADGKAPSYLRDEEKELRRRLRAHARTLGDQFDKGTEQQEVKRLIEAGAYAHWHRMLFARFLAERGLLRHPEHDVTVTLEDCREIAQEEGAADAWAIAERYAAAMLPAVFRIDDPVLSLLIDPGQSQALHRLVTELGSDTFQAEDSLGWTYQFWRAAEKDAVNKSGVKIGADELPAVTQLFTEAYMVRFLLHNTLGAWWAGKVLAADPVLAQTAADESTLRAACLLPQYNFDMLRFVREGTDGPWRPAAGFFLGWPNEAKEITMLDPCCGSGHFLTEALAILVALRQAEENLSSADAVNAVLRDNLHGLEIDGRCVQIAAFAVAISAWRIGGWQTLPLPHIAWVGAPPPLPKKEFVALADGDTELEYALAALHDLFARAPVLGTLLEPSGGDIFEAEKMKQVEKLLSPLLAKVRQAEPEQSEGAVAARGMADAAALLHQRYVLQATNVPYLGRGKQDQILAEYIERRFHSARADLASAMLSRMSTLAIPGGTFCAVTPQSWLFLGSYKEFRHQLLTKATFDIVGALGPRAFETISGEVVNTALIALSNSPPDGNASFSGLDANDGRRAEDKAGVLRSGECKVYSQSRQLRNPDHIISLIDQAEGPLLQEHAWCHQGTSTGDNDRCVRFFWEHYKWPAYWRLFSSPPSQTADFGAASLIVNWKTIEGRTTNPAIRGTEAWGRKGFLFGQNNSLPVVFYTGESFGNSSPVLIPEDESRLPAIAAFVFSGALGEAVRAGNRKLSIDNGYIGKVPFDLSHWTRLAEERYPNGLPEPYSSDPAQWYFHGYPAEAAVGNALHVALSRLCGYSWPAECDARMWLSNEARASVARAAALPEGDADGLLSVPGVAGEKPLADRLRAYLATAYGPDWSDALERRLVAEADEKLDKKIGRDGSLEAWLRNRAFRQHCILFQQRPFIWHIWDGLEDGFSVFVHYHRFTQANLRKLTYTMLGDWLARAKAENNDLRYEKGRELQQMLERVLEGESPYDTFVRWKALVEQPLGWQPDLDDGVRMNIRPFMEAGVLREQPKGIKWTKDRGTDVPSAPWYPVFTGERINDHHTTLEEKRAARAANAERATTK
jgi:hypothetical protein